MSRTLTFIDNPDKWYPTSIQILEEHLGVLLTPNAYFSSSEIAPLKKNLAYTLQYVEFLDRVIKDINLSTVLWTQNVKSFVVYGASVVEAIFNYLVISTDNGNATKWQSVKKVITPQFDLNGVKHKNDIELFKEIGTPIQESMTFDQLAKKVESKKLLRSNFAHYAKIKPIRRLRNKIHIHGVEHATDTDWWNFNQKEYELIRHVLKAVLISSVFIGSAHKSKFNYLKNS